VEGKGWNSLKMSVFRNQRQEDQEFKVSLGYIVRNSIKKQAIIK
jgi:hypothetical protein